MKSEIWNPEEGISIRIFPLGFVDHYENFAKLEPDSGTSLENRVNILKEIVKDTLKKAVPDATDEELREVSVNHILDLINVIKKVNACEVDVDEEFIEHIKKMQSGKPDTEKAPEEEQVAQGEKETP